MVSARQLYLGRDNEDRRTFDFSPIIVYNIPYFTTELAHKSGEVVVPACPMMSKTMN